MYKEVIEFIKSLYPNQNPVPLHAPVFSGNEKQYLLDCIDSTYVSYLGEFVTKFEETVSTYTGAKYSISMVNGTSALQVALNAIGVKRNTEVITQALTFVATANAISLSGGKPVFIDVDKDTLGMSPNSLEKFLIENCFINDSGICFNKNTNKEITACVPVHIFGHPCKIDEIIGEYLKHIMDDKPITARQCIKTLPVIARYKPDLISCVCNALHKANPQIYKSSMQPLIFKDIQDALKTSWM